MPLRLPSAAGLGVGVAVRRFTRMRARCLAAVARSEHERDDDEGRDHGRAYRQYRCLYSMQFITSS